MKEIKVYYAKVENMGDLLNELIIEKVFGYKVKYCPRRLSSRTTGIGSFLGSLFPVESKKLKFPKNVVGAVIDKVNPPLQIWSSGFMYYPTNEKEVSLRKNIKISSVRGELTRKRLENILDTKLDVPTGDAGLLASLLIDEPIEKKYDIGVIAHIKERNEDKFRELTEHYENSILIDLTEDPLEVVRKISQCKLIISTALHGLIVADSFGIPNKRLIYTDNLLGDGYKFDDYYSSFGVDNKYFDLNGGDFPSIKQITDDYNISQSVVEEKKKQIMKAFSENL